MKQIFDGIPAEFFVADIPKPSNLYSPADMNLIESSNNTESLTSSENSFSNKTNISLMENSHITENITSIP